MKQVITRKYIYSYDVIRILAILAVILIHTSAEFVVNSSVSSVSFLIGNIFDSISRFGVPFFVMLSGSLILNEEKNFTFKKMFHYCLNILLLLYFWSFVYSLIYRIILPVLSHETISIKEFLYSFLFGHSHLWYLFMIIGLYLITPILKSFVKKSNLQVVQWFIILAVCFEFLIPICNFFINHFIMSGDIAQIYADKFNLHFVGQFTTYYLLGWYISNIKLEKKHRLFLYSIGFISLIFTIISIQLFITPDNKIYTIFYKDISINILLYSVALFTFLYYYFQNHECKKYKSIIRKLSQLTFGVYIIHILVLSVILKLISHFFEIKNTLLSILIIFTLTALISFLITYTMSKIPLIKKLVKF